MTYEYPKVQDLTIYQKPVLVYSLPRSRTYWLSQLATYIAHYGKNHHEHISSIGYHDPLCKLNSFSALKERADSQPKQGGIIQYVICDTGAAYFYPIFEHFWPGHRKLVIRRDSEEVVNSLYENDLVPDEIDDYRLGESIAMENHFLDEIEEQFPDDVLSIPFPEINENIERIWSLLFPDFPLPDRKKALVDKVLVKDPKKMREDMEEAIPRLKRLIREGDEIVANFKNDV